MIAMAIIFAFNKNDMNIYVKGFTKFTSQRIIFYEEKGWNIVVENVRRKEVVVWAHLGGDKSNDTFPPVPSSLPLFWLFSQLEHLFKATTPRFLFFPQPNATVLQKSPKITSSESESEGPAFFCQKHHGWNEF